MMTSTSYVVALVMYVISAGVGAWLINRLVFAALSHRLSYALTGLLVGLLVIPSFASTESTTLAPAFITAVFNLLFAGGLEAALPALLMLALGALLGLTGGLIWARLSISRLEEH